MRRNKHTSLYCSLAAVALIRGLTRWADLNAFVLMPHLCARTRKVSQGGLISLHILCLQFIHAHWLACLL